ncbi:MAG: sensor domain-containing diguanylate cyclase [Alkalispirochaeta sp.]
MALIPPESETDGDYVSLRKSTLSWMGFFVKDFESPENGFPNRYWIEYGYGLSEMDYDQWLERVHPDDRSRAAALETSAQRHDRFRGNERYRVRDSAGTYHWVLSVGAVDERFPDGSPKRYVGLDFDVTEIQKLQEELSQARETAEQRAAEAEVLRNAAAAIVSTLDKTGAIVRVVTELLGMMPISRAVVFEQRDRILQPAVDPKVLEAHDAMTALSAADQELFERGVGHDVLVDVMRRRAPDMFRDPERAGNFWLVAPLVVRSEVMGVYAVGRSDGVPFVAGDFRVVSAVADYLALALSNAHLYDEVGRLAETDGLSGLLSRRALFTRAEALCARAISDGTRLACVLLDIDLFKDLNDSYGHQQGDEVIRQVAAVLWATVRTNDTVGRYGGEEFCAFLPETTGDEALRVAQRICDGVRRLSFEEVPRTVTVSLGVAELAPGESLDGLIGRTDAALYRAKRGGRDRVEYDA